MDRSLAWYEAVLGFTVKQRNTYDLPNQGHVQMAWIEHEGFYLELYQYPQPLRPFTVPDYLGSLGTKHVCFALSPQGLSALLDHLQAQGANVIIRCRWPNDQRHTPVSPLPFDADPETSHRVVYITDPDGIWIEFQEAHKPGEGVVAQS